jgi:hypothetical protein
MTLVLVILLAFVLIGIIPQRFDTRQQVVIAMFGVALAMMQFTLARFL